MNRENLRGVLRDSFGFGIKVLMTSVFFVVSTSCSSTSNLRKFNEADISQEISEDLAKKFEVKDAQATPVASAVPGNTNSVAPENNLKSKSKKKTKKGKKEVAAEKQTLEIPMRRPAVLPFEVGEKLQYDIRYLGVTAGYINFEVQSMKEVDSRKVYHLAASAKTVKLFELIYRVDDSIESYWDYDGMFSHRFSMNLDESKQTRKLIELYDYDKKECFYWDRIDRVDKGFSEKKEKREIQLWSQDILSAMYYVRVIDLPKVAGEEVRFPVILDGKPWETVIKFKKKATVYANDKNYNANVYTLENYEGGVLKNKDNTLWLSDDEHRYILRVEAKVKVGSFAVALENVL